MSIEQRLERDIAQVKESVVVTEQDLRNARNAVAERADAQRRRHRQRAAVAVATAAAAVAIVGVNLFQAVGADDQSAPPAGPNPTLNDPDADFLRGEPPTPATVGGLWRVDNGNLSLILRDDGTVQLDFYGQVFSNPGMTGVYAIDGSLITISWDGDTRCGETSLAMRVSIPKPGAMHIVPTASPGGECAPFGVGQTDLEQVLPTSPGLAGLASLGQGWKPLSKWTALDGDWLAEAGGFVLEIDADGSYLVIDSSTEPVDRGRWSLRRSTLTLTSSTRSMECNAGDVLSWGAMEQADPGTTTIRGTVEQNTCGGTWTPKAWILIPHVGS